MIILRFVIFKLERSISIIQGLLLVTELHERWESSPNQGEVEREMLEIVDTSSVQNHLNKTSTQEFLQTLFL